MKDFKIYDCKIYKVEFCVKKYNGIISPVRVGYGKMEYVDSKKIEDIYVKKTISPNVVKELKTGKKIPVIYKETLHKDYFGYVDQRKINGALSSPYFVLIHTDYCYSPVKYNFTSNVSLKDLEEYATLDYETFKKDLNYNIVAALHDEDFYLNKGMIRVSSPWREKVNTIRQKLKSKGEERKAIKKEKKLKKELVKNMKEQRRK